MECGSLEGVVVGPSSCLPWVRPCTKRGRKRGGTKTFCACLRGLLVTDRSSQHWFPVTSTPGAVSLQCDLLMFQCTHGMCCVTCCDTHACMRVHRTTLVCTQRPEVSQSFCPLKATRLGLLRRRLGLLRGRLGQNSQIRLGWPVSEC